MRHLITITILTVFVSISYSQDKLTDSQKKSFLTNSQFKLTPSQIKEAFKRPDNEGWLKVSDYADSTPFECAYSLNVFDYFQLNDTYDSDLKKEGFKQTAGYKSLLDSLRTIKSNYLNSIYYRTSFEKGDFNEDVEEIFDIPNVNGGYQINYDIQTKGFFIKIGKVVPYTCLKNFCPKVIQDVEFKQLTITKKYNTGAGLSENSYTQYLFIPMDDSTALEIENNRSQFNVLLVFNIIKVYTETFNDADFLEDNHGRICKIKLVKGGNFRLLIYNKSTEKVYFDKLYPTIQTK